MAKFLAAWMAVWIMIDRAERMEDLYRVSTDENGQL